MIGISPGETKPHSKRANRPRTYTHHANDTQHVKITSYISKPSSEIISYRIEFWCEGEREQVVVWWYTFRRVWSFVVTPYYRCKAQSIYSGRIHFNLTYPHEPTSEGGPNHIYEYIGQNALHSGLHLLQKPNLYIDWTLQTQAHHLPYPEINELFKRYDNNNNNRLIIVVHHTHTHTHWVGVCMCVCVREVKLIALPSSESTNICIQHEMHSPPH